MLTHSYSYRITPFSTFKTASKLPTRALALQVDVTNEQQVDAAVAASVKEFGQQISKISISTFER